MNTHVKDSIAPGDKCAEHDADDNKNHVHEDSSFIQLIVISETSTARKVWAALYLFSCFTSPYFYAWVALFGHEKGESGYLITSIIFETIFATNILVNFLTEYVPDGEIVPERDIAKIADRYFHTDFLMEFIPTFPLTFIFNNTHEKYWRLFYLIKVIRIVKGIEIYDVQMMMDFLKEKNMQRVMKNIENDPTLIQNLDLD